MEAEEADGKQKTAKVRRHAIGLLDRILADRAARDHLTQLVKELETLGKSQ